MPAGDTWLARTLTEGTACKAVGRVCGSHQTAGEQVGLVTAGRLRTERNPQIPDPEGKALWEGPPTRPRGTAPQATTQHEQGSQHSTAKPCSPRGSSTGGGHQELGAVGLWVGQGWGWTWKSRQETPACPHPWGRFPSSQILGLARGGSRRMLF